jgi:hypothetical protein
MDSAYERAISEPVVFAVDPVSCFHGLVYAAADPPESRVTSRSVRSQSTLHRAPKQWLTSELGATRRGARLPEVAQPRLEGLNVLRLVP